MQHWNYLVALIPDRPGFQTGQFTQTNALGDLEGSWYYWGEYQADTFLPGPQVQAAVQNQLLLSPEDGGFPPGYTDGRFFMLINLSYLGEY